MNKRNLIFVPLVLMMFLTGCSIGNKDSDEQESLKVIYDVPETQYLLTQTCTDNKTDAVYKAETCITDDFSYYSVTYTSVLGDYPYYNCTCYVSDDYSFLSTNHGADASDTSNLIVNSISDASEYNTVLMNFIPIASARSYTVVKESDNQVHSFETNTGSSVSVITYDCTDEVGADITMCIDKSTHTLRTSHANLNDITTEYKVDSPVVNVPTYTDFDDSMTCSDAYAEVDEFKRQCYSSFISERNVQSDLSKFVAEEEAIE